MTPEIQQQLKSFVGTVRPVQVLPVEFSVKRTGEPPAAGAEVHLRIDLQSSARAREGGFEAVFVATIAGEREVGGEAFVHFHWIGAVIYATEAPFTPELIDAYAKTSSTMQVWPYLREFVSSSCARLAIPQLTLPPMLNVPLPPPLAAGAGTKSP